MNKIVKNLEKAFDDFVRDFADPAVIVKAVVEEKIKCKIDQVFDNQKSIDYAKSVYGKKGLKTVIALYFSQFQIQTGINYHALDIAIKKNSKNLCRHLGPDKIQFLKLFVMFLLDLEKNDNEADTKRGLLYVMRE